MFNPFFIYSISWIYVFILYSLKWSNLNPHLTLTMVIFLLITIIVMFMCGIFFKNKVPIKWQEIQNNKFVFKISALLLFLHVVNFIYARKIPLLEILFKRGYVYTQDFNGIPFLQTIILSSSVFLITYLYHMILSTKNGKIIVLFFVNIIPLILIFYRILFVIIILNCLWLSLFKINKISIKVIGRVFVLFLIAGYIFGISGDARTANQYNLYKSDNNSQIIMRIGEASEEFKNSIVPKPYFWVYLYSTSSLANFQSITNQYSNKDIKIINFVEYFNNEILYNMISFRINRLLDINKVELALNSPALNVSSIYGYAHYYLNWMGDVLMFLYTLILCVIYYLFMRKDKEFFLVSIAILNTIIFLNIFYNMFTWTTLSIQLLIPILFKLFNNLKLRIRERNNFDHNINIQR